MNRFIFLFGLIILVFLVLIWIHGTSLSLAGIPKMINYQGMLTDNSGNPLTDTVSITFKIYDDSSGGNKKWEETQSSVPVINGMFNVILGSVSPIDLDFSEDYWLDITVGAEHMPTRLKFTSVGYAYRAKIADSAMVAISAPTGGGWTDNGSVVRLTTGSDDVGIGTASPQAKLHIAGGDVKLDFNSDIIMLQENGYSSEIKRYGNNLWLCNFAAGYINFGTGVSAGGAAYVRLHISNDGKVGIGTITPDDDLHVANHIRVGEDATYPTVYGELKHDGGGTGFIINANSGGGWADLHFQTNGTTKMFLESGGNVGIGTTSPSKKLHVLSTTTDHAVYGDNTSSYNTYGFLGKDVGAYGQCRTSGYHGYLGGIVCGVYYSGGLAGSGSKSCIVKTSKGPTLLYCQESPENWFEDFGEAQLNAGRCHIEIDPLFLETVTIDDQNPMKVFIQLNDDCNGTYVQRGGTGFDVIELQGGQSSARFTYRVVAKRSGFEDKRLDVCEAGRTDPYLYPEMKEKADR